MEVHQHTHTPRKRWTHYFWEFFILFLAVIAGFLVENQREHYIEHKRAKVLAASLYSDFKNDITSLQSLGIKINRVRLLLQFEKMSQKAEEILSFIKKEYHLE